MIHFWLLFIGFQVTFLIQHWLGAAGMPRRYGDYAPEDNFVEWNRISTFGSILLGISTLVFLYNVWRTYKRGVRVTEDDPWGWGRSLEWATSCPPPRHNFDSIPRIRSESPAFDLHHPEIALAEGDVENPSVLASAYGAPEVQNREDIIDDVVEGKGGES
jgi:cytochrome c oxidase subunit 1